MVVVVVVVDGSRPRSGDAGSHRSEGQGQGCSSRGMSAEGRARGGRERGNGVNRRAKFRGWERKEKGVEEKRKVKQGCGSVQGRNGGRSPTLMGARWCGGASIRQAANF